MHLIPLIPSGKIKLNFLGTMNGLKRLKNHGHGTFALTERNTVLIWYFVKQGLYRHSAFIVRIGQKLQTSRKGDTYFILRLLP